MTRGRDLDFLKKESMTMKKIEVVSVCSPSAGQGPIALRAGSNWAFERKVSAKSRLVAIHAPDFQRDHVALSSFEVGIEVPPKPGDPKIFFGSLDGFDVLGGGLKENTPVVPISAFDCHFVAHGNIVVPQTFRGLLWNLTEENNATTFVPRITFVFEHVDD